MKFKPGQKVVFLHEQGGGIIESIDNKGLYVIDAGDGFSRSYRENELAAVHGEDYGVDDDDIAIIREDSVGIKVDHVTHREYDRKRQKEIDVWEIDLHIEQLTNSHKGMTNSEIIARQMSAFKLFFNKGREHSIRKMIAIHGVGEGVLKHEVRNYLDQHDAVTYYDADFGEYGKGATAIEVDYRY